MNGHAQRVPSAAWSTHLLSTARQDAVILNRDMRAPEGRVAILRGHQGEACALKLTSVLAHAPDIHLVSVRESIIFEHILLQWHCQDEVQQTGASRS